MKIISETAIINTTPKLVFDFLANPANLFHLLPQDKISDFQSTNTNCSFKVQGGILIPFVYSELIPYTQIIMKSGEKAPFDFTLTIHIKEENEVTEGYIEFNSKPNMFLKMMIEKPLTSLFNSMSKKLQEQF